VSDELVSKAGHQRYPLVEGKVQAEIMPHVRAEVRTVSKARLIEALNSSRNKISAEVARLIEKGLPFYRSFSMSLPRTAEKCSQSVWEYPVPSSRRPGC